MSSRRSAPPADSDWWGRRGKHTKIHGYVTHIDGDKWWAMLIVDDTEVIGEMSLPLPEDRRHEGHVFTAHRTKAGHTYLFWPPAAKIASRRRKEVRRRATEWARVFKDET